MNSLRRRRSKRYGMSADRDGRHRVRVCRPGPGGRHAAVGRVSRRARSSPGAGDGLLLGRAQGAARARGADAVRAACRAGGIAPPCLAGLPGRSDRAAAARAATGTAAGGRIAGRGSAAAGPAASPAKHSAGTAGTVTDADRAAAGRRVLRRRRLLGERRHAPRPRRPASAGAAWAVQRSGQLAALPVARRTRHRCRLEPTHQALYRSQARASTAPSVHHLHQLPGLGLHGTPVGAVHQPQLRLGARRQRRCARQLGKATARTGHGLHAPGPCRRPVGRGQARKEDSASTSAAAARCSAAPSFAAYCIR